jgi:hypothetical protein
MSVRDGILDTVLADLAADAGDEPDAAMHADRAVRLRRELGDRSLLASSLVAGARRGISSRQRAETAALLHEGLDLARTAGDAWTESLALSTLGALAVVGGDVAEGRRLLSDALEVARRRSDNRVVAECVHGLAAAAALEGDTHRAARLLGAAEALRASAGATMSTVERAVDELAVSRLSGENGGVLGIERSAGELLEVEAIVLLALGDPIAISA